MNMGSTESTPPRMEENTSNSSSNYTTHIRRETVDASRDDSWWWEIENEDLILDHHPNVTTSLRHRGGGGVVEEAKCLEDLDALLKIGQDVNNAINSDNFDKNNDSTTSKILDESTQSEGAAVTTRLSINWSARDSRHESQSLDDFKEELRQKRLARQTALQDLREEITMLRKQLTAEQTLTRRLLQGRNAAEAPSFQTSQEIHLGTGKNWHATVTCFENVAYENEINSTDAEVKYARSEKEVIEKSNMLGNETNLTDITNTSNNTDIEDDLGPDIPLSNLDEDDENACSRSRHANIELANVQLALQLATSENLSLATELGVIQKQVATLKEVVTCCKQMLALKEDQCKQLKTKLSEIEESFAERETKMMSDQLRQEYERQLGNIRQLRQLYEERQRIAAIEQENLQRLISIKKDELAGEQERTKNFEERNQALMKEVETAHKELAALREECSGHKFEKRALKEEMGAINTLFSQMVMGFHGKNNLDIDRLAIMLEENRTLLNDMATKEANCSDGATLPKLLFELVEQAAVGSKANSRSSSPGAEEEQDEGCTNEGEGQAERGTHSLGADESIEVATYNEADGLRDTLAVTQDDTLEGEEIPNENIENDTDKTTISHNNTSENNFKIHHQPRRSPPKKMKKTCAFSSTSPTLKFHQPEVLGKVASTQEIIGNLPKVWKVLMELLSHHKTEQVQFEENGAGEDCYKSVETPNGVKAELSVSKTYIKLKDLILEKKSLVKETNRLKTLNCHLDYRLNEQEKRLSAVSLELTKTWHLVGKMQRQHRQLHTQEQILRYQLQQKRRLLSELREELEYCRRKWAAARAKNDESQDQCNDLRREFARRKLEDANNSAESGYSDSGPQSDEEGGGRHLSEVTPEVVYNPKTLLQMFEHSRKIKRMQSTSPGRAFCDGRASVVLLRSNSAPSTCGWRTIDDDDDDNENKDKELEDEAEDAEVAGDQDDKTEENNSDDDGLSEICPQKPSRITNGAIPKQRIRLSRSKERLRANINADTSEDFEATSLTNTEFQLSSMTNDDPAAVRIQRLEEQCKSLIQKVIETSDTRERLEIQLCHFQDAIAPVQYAVPLNELITSKRLERMTRASSVPTSAAGTLTPREEEYTRKRSERLERLEEESRQLISRIKRTSDRGHYLRCSLDRLHKTRNSDQSSSAAISREGSFESNTEEEEPAVNGTFDHTGARGKVNFSEKLERPTKILTEGEEVYIARRSERLKRLEAESKELLAKLSQNAQRGSTLSNQLDVLHEQHGHSKADEETDSRNSNTTFVTPLPTLLKKRIENIERIFDNRSDRLRILQEEGNQLIARLSSTSERGTQMINRIADREQSRSVRRNDNESTEVDGTVETTLSPALMNSDDMSEEKDRDAAAISVAAAAPLLPPLKNVACSSIVFDELSECVTVTTTSSQIAQATQHLGAADRPKPLAQLSVIAHTKAKTGASSSQSGATETLEEMVRRLQGVPFPDAESTQTLVEPMGTVDLGKTEEGTQGSDEET